MKRQHRKIRALIRFALIAASLGLASADIMVVHDVVYIDESGAYYLNAQIHDKLGNLIPTPIPYTYKNGIPALTIQSSAIGKDRKIRTGDIQLLEPAGTPGGGTPSDLIRFLAGPPDKNGDPSFYSLQFFSGKNEGFDEGGNLEKPVPGDVGFTPDPHAKQVNEVDLEFATAKWRLAGTDNPDPNAKLNLKGKSGFAYIARCPDTSNPNLQNCDIGGILPFREGPIGYIFVSDTVSTPEPASFTLLLAGIGLSLYSARKRLT